MKVLMTTWEFPPHKVGGIASHCHDLSIALARLGHEVHVLTAAPAEGTEEILPGVTVHRLRSAAAPDLITWANFMGERLEKKAIELHKEEGFEVVHGHDWMMVPAAVGIKKTLNLPMVFTLHSTEAGRSGVHDSYTKTINDLEWLGTYEAADIIAVGRDFRSEIKSLFNPPEDKLHYVPNGVDVNRFDDLKFFVDKNDYAADWELMVLFVGRLSNQKGVDHLVHSIPKVLKEHPEAKFVISGAGAVDYYKGLVNKENVGHKVFFTGYVDERLLPALFKTADVTVAPSVYEPFGIVALESSAAETPVVGSYTGGLKDTIVHEQTGLHSQVANSESIAEQLDRMLSDTSWRRWLGQNGRKLVQANYTWDKIAHWTTGVYGKAAGLWS